MLGATYATAGNGSAPPRRWAVMPSPRRLESRNREAKARPDSLSRTKPESHLLSVAKGFKLPFLLRIQTARRRRPILAEQDASAVRILTTLKFCHTDWAPIPKSVKRQHRFQPVPALCPGLSDTTYRTITCILQVMLVMSRTCLEGLSQDAGPAVR